jgi:hypothetical protein
MLIETFCRRTLLASTILVFGLAVAPYEATGTDTTADQGTPLEEVIVTARKQVEDLDKVPISISVLERITIQNLDAFPLSRPEAVGLGAAEAPSSTSHMYRGNNRSRPGIMLAACHRTTAAT